jgi:prolyl oligopeptidase
MPSSTQFFQYPPSPVVDQKDLYHGVEVADPYRWLEDPDSAESRAWIEAQNQLTFGYLAQIPQREAIKQRLTQLWDYEKFGIPFKRGDRYFYFKNDGLQNQSVLYTLNALDDQPRELLDPNQLSEDGTIALSGLSLSQDGQWLAYGLSASGSDWQEWRVRSVETGEDERDRLRWVKFSGASWTADHQGFFYSRYPEPNESTQFEDINHDQKLYYHRLGTDQADDPLVFELRDRKEALIGGGVTEDGKYLVISVHFGSDPKNLVFYKDLMLPDAPVVELIGTLEAEYSLIDSEGSLFWFQTNLDAPCGRVIAIEVTNPDRAQWREVIPEASETLQGVSLFGDRFVASYLKDAYSQVKILTLQGEFIQAVDLPGIGSVGGFGGERQDTETFYSFTSFTTPTTIYRYDLTTGESTLFRQPQVDFNPDNYEVKQIFYSSKDGTQVPLFIAHKKGLALSGNTPTYLYGYGGFNVSLTPSFSIGNLVWMERGGVYAVANLRGGGEYGEAWHQAGTKLNKQNVFDDFIAAAEWLIQQGYTSARKLAIAGGSNGGLLVGACMTQRPELFGAALPAVGVMDMLRFPKFTIGWAWISDYGSPENPDEFNALYAYSPLHNLKPGTTYPATMVTTADHDDRVVPAHSFKFAAALQSAHYGAPPVLIRIDTKAGHGAGKPTAKIIEEMSDRWAFLEQVLEQ